uniref:Uncharacterized protein n=1 Tax=Solanum lycopersicum TaxID=4081 RepID=A0A3Q7EC20_SOLLC
MYPSAELFETVGLMFTTIVIVRCCQLELEMHMKVQAYILATLIDLLVNMCNKLMSTSSAAQHLEIFGSLEELKCRPIIFPLWSLLRLL